MTTLTPGEQEFSIVNKGARPSKLAPYPTLVGTAMIGISIKPEITEGKAPSIPATTMTTLALFIDSILESSLCRPATPTSKSDSALHPIDSAVNIASCATGISDVPAATTIMPGVFSFIGFFSTEIIFETSSNFASLKCFLISKKVSLLDLVIKRFVD